VLLGLLAVVPALAPAQGGDEAKKLFQAMEERLTKAKSVSLRFRIDVEAAGKKVMALQDSLAFTADNRVRFESEGKTEGKSKKRDDKVTLTSDGKRLRYVFKEGAKVIKDREIPTPKNLSAELAWMLSRPGLSVGFEFLELATVRKKEIKPAELFPITDLKASGTAKIEGREARVFTYKVKDRKQRSVDITVWVDPLTRLPLKRVAVMDRQGMKGRLIELYTNFTIDAKLDPKQFELPK
jgi:outer membrane lipoprotein-sorting protein